MPLNLCIVMLEISADYVVWGTFYSVYSNFPSKFPLQQKPEDWSDFANISLLPELNKFTHVRNRTFHNGTVVKQFLTENMMNTIKPCWLH